MAAVAAPNGGNTPNSTVYVRLPHPHPNPPITLLQLTLLPTQVKNLEESIKIPELTTALTEIFSEYGTVIDLVAKRNLKAKGQAFIVFDDVEAAERAIAEVQGFELYDKPMVLEYARTRSDRTVEREGGEEELVGHKRRRLAEKERKQAQEALEAAKKLKRPAPAPTPETTTGRPVKASRGAGLKSSNPAGAAAVPDEYLPPNKILFVQNLPGDYGIEELTAVFGRFEGFREVRLVPGRKGIAFVEYEMEEGAISAKEGTAGVGVGMGGDQRGWRVTYQRQ
ncbi:MAG: hypothetical protein M1827_002269 [Pycnora praestabilis]|nr:MAG: hypothetical protein M1827_002269 [Pycnora praestabilis]